MTPPFSVIATLNWKPKVGMEAVYVPLPLSVARTGELPVHRDQDGVPAPARRVALRIPRRHRDVDVVEDATAPGTVAVLAPGLTGPGATALVKGLPGIGVPPTRISTRSLPAAVGV